jgi:CarD family transcriptional regulator
MFKGYEMSQMKASERSGLGDRTETTQAAMTGGLGRTGRKQALGRKPEAQVAADTSVAGKAAAPSKATPKAAVHKAAAPLPAPPKPAKAALATAAKPKLEKIVPERQLPEVVLAVEAPATIAKSAAPKAAPDKPAAEKPVAEMPAVVQPAAAKPAGFSAPIQEAAPAPAVEPERRPSVPEGERRPNVNDRNPPRIPSKAENFVEGDHVVYPTHGVGKVERIVVEEIAGHSLELIHITFEENRMTLRVPVAKARSAGLRKLASRKMFDEALAVLRGRARIKRTMWSRRAQEYEAKINSGDPLAIAEVVRDLHRNAGQPDQSFSERQIYEAAMDRLAAELGALDKTDKQTAATKLLNFLKTVA